MTYDWKLSVLNHDKLECEVGQYRVSAQPMESDGCPDCPVRYRVLCWRGTKPIGEAMKASTLADAKQIGEAMLFMARNLKEQP